MYIRQFSEGKKAEQNFAWKKLVLYQLFDDLVQRNQTKSQILIWMLKKMNEFKFQSNSDWVLCQYKEKKHTDNFQRKLLSINQMWMLIASHI